MFLRATTVARANPKFPPPMTAIRMGYGGGSVDDDIIFKQEEDEDVEDVDDEDVVEDVFIRDCILVESGFKSSCRPPFTAALVPEIVDPNAGCCNDKVEVVVVVGEVIKA